MERILKKQLKLLLLALTLSLILAISGIVCSANDLSQVDNIIDQNGQVGIGTTSGSDQEQIPQVFDPGNVNKERPNLLIGGIDQKSPDPNQNDQAYRTFAANNNALYIPTYYTGSIVSDGLEVNNAAKSIKTYKNGLRDDALNGKTYGTIFAYSGGTTSVVTAIAEQNVRADKLVLISPMKGWFPGDKFDWQGEFAKKIQKILASGTKIEVFQSPDDNPPFGSYYQYKFPTGTSSAIIVHNVKTEGHWEFFKNFAVNHIKNGEYVETTPAAFTGTPKGTPIDVFLFFIGIDTILVHRDVTYIPVSGVQVTGQDGSGNRFQKTTENGCVLIEGTPGNWTFKVSGFDWVTKSWSQTITSNCSIEVVLENTLQDSLSQWAQLNRINDTQKQESAAPVASGSESSIVGRWNIVMNIPEPFGGGSFPIHFFVIFNADGTFNIPEQHYNEVGSGEWSYPAAAGKWTQNGESISWDSGYVGTIHMNSMSGMRDGKISWSATRVGS